jgi:phospholipid/cholesterol/gamma-HCH transport system permease protein
MEGVVSFPALTLDADPATLIVSGPWTAAQSVSLEQLVAASPSISTQRRNVAIDISGVDRLDTLGAWLLERLMRGCEHQELNPTFVVVPERFRG